MALLVNMNKYNISPDDILSKIALNYDNYSLASYHFREMVLLRQKLTE